MNKKLASIGAVLAIMTGLLYIGELKNTEINTYKTSESYKGIEQLRKNVNFPFNVPKKLLDEKDLTFKNLGGQMVEISNTNMKFKSAKFINDKVDVSGDYAEYKLDKRFTVSGATIIRHLRIRSNSSSLDSMDKAVLNYDTGSIVYSLGINTHCTYQDIISILDLTSEQLKLELVAKDLKPEEKESVLSSTTNNNEVVQSTGDITYDIHQLHLLGYRIRLPKTLSTIKIIEGDSEFKYATFFILGKPILTIEEHNELGYNAEVSMCINIKDGYTLKYYKTNPFEQHTEQYDSYEAIINSVEFIVHSFEQIKKIKAE